MIANSIGQADGSGTVGQSTVAPDYAFELRAWRGENVIRANVFSGGAEAFGVGRLLVTEDVEGVVVAMQPAPEVTARVRMADGSAVNLKGVRLLSLAQGTVREARTDAAGRASFAGPLRPGKHEFAVDPKTLPAGCYVQEMSAEEFEVSAATQVEVVLATRAGATGGLVVDGEGRAVPDVKVTLVSADGRVVREFSQADGSFAFGALRPGRYQVFAWEDVDNSLWPDPEFRSRFVERASTVEVVLGETRKVEVRLIGAEEVR